MSDEIQIRYTFPPWKVSLWGASLGLSFAALFAIFPQLHRLPLPGEYYFPTVYPVLSLPAISSIWAAVGIVRRKQYGNTFWCYFSLLLSFFSVGFTVVAVWMESGTR